MTAAEVLEALLRHHGVYGPDARAVIAVPELRMESGWGYYSEKRVDLFVMQVAQSKGNERTAYEIKVSVSDFKKELRTPTKRWSGMMFSNRFYFAAPVDVIDPERVPNDCGLVEVSAGGNVRVVVKAPFRESAPPTWPFIASLVRSVRSLDDGHAVLRARLAADSRVEGKVQVLEVQGVRAQEEPD